MASSTFVVYRILKLEYKKKGFRIGFVANRFLSPLEIAMIERNTDVERSIKKIIKDKNKEETEEQLSQKFSDLLTELPYKI